MQFGDIELKDQQIEKMGKTLWSDYMDETIAWRDMRPVERKAFIREFINPIPNVLASVGLGIIKK
jgi:hypothetical protein